MIKPLLTAIRYALFSCIVAVSMPFFSFSQTGVLDVTFGQSGKVVTTVGDSDAVVHAIALQPDGKIIAAGHATVSGAKVFAVARYNANGSLDPSFGAGGKVFTNAGNGDQQAYAVAMQPDGKIIAAGLITSATLDPWGGFYVDNFGLVRYRPNGAIDSSFGVNGIAMVDASKADTVGGGSHVTSLLIRPNGKIVAGGVSNTRWGLANYPGMNFAMAQFNMDGSLDTTFGKKGTQSTDLGYNWDDYLSQIALQPDGKVVACGTRGIFSYSGLQMALVRYKENGGLDSTFSNDGIAIRSYGGYNGNGTSTDALAIQPDGKIVIAGQVRYGPSFIFMNRFNANGTEDANFFKDIKLPSNTDAASIHIQPDGKYVIAGTTNIATFGPGNSNFLLVRQHPNRTFDSSFGKRGFITTDFAGKDETCFASIIQPDGKIIVAGSSVQGNQTVFALARYERNAFLYYNSICGTVFLDKNANGVKDSNEPLWKNASATIIKPGIDTIKAGTSNGMFSIDVDTGTYISTVTPSMPYYTVVPASITTSQSTYFNTDNMAFALQPIAGKRDLSVTLFPMGPARPGFLVKYKLLYKNNGTDTVTNGTIELRKDHRLDFVSATATSSFNSGDTLRWAFSGLKPLDTASITIILKVKAPPLVGISDTLRSVATIASSVPDLTPADNVSTVVQRTRGSYDPNDKMESHGESIDIQKVQSGEYLQYTIRFQNTGTDMAFNVYIRDTLSGKVDWNTFEMISSSADYQLSITNGNQCLWSFFNINLPDSNQNEPGSHGYIVYRVKPKASLAVGDVVNNMAAIYFDYNLPVFTNVERTTVTAEVLPLRLLTFTASKLETNCLLKWTTTGELNVDRFEVQRSANGRDFTTIGVVPAGLSMYEFIDVNPFEKVSYYRLRMIDKDAMFSFSNVVLLTWHNVKADVFPNPASSSITVSHSKAEKGATIRVLSIDGRPLKVIQVKPGAQQTGFSVDDLGSGNYLLIFDNKNEKVIVKFRKQ